MKGTLKMSVLTFLIFETEQNDAPTPLPPPLRSSIDPRGTERFRHHIFIHSRKPVNKWIPGKISRLDGP